MLPPTWFALRRRLPILQTHQQAISHKLLLSSNTFNIGDQLQVFAPDLCPALVDHNTRSLFPIVSPRRHLFQVQLNTMWIVFCGNRLFQYSSFSPITVLPCGLQSAFLCPLLLVTMVGDFIERYFTFLKSENHIFTIMIALVQQQFGDLTLILIVIIA